MKNKILGKKYILIEIIKLIYLKIRLYFATARLRRAQRYNLYLHQQLEKYEKEKTNSDNDLSEM